jgi:hypothetical protein
MAYSQALENIGFANQVGLIIKIRLNLKSRDKIKGIRYSAIPDALNGILTL